MGRKSRAQLDAERLAALEQAQTRVDSGEVSADEVVANLEGDDGISTADREEMYRDIDERIARSNGEEQPKETVKKPEPKVETIDPREIAELKRQLSFYEQELNPAQKRAQQLEREVEELRAQLAARPAQPDGPVDYGLTEEEQEFETVTSIAEKVSKATAAKMLKEVDALKAKLAEFEGLNTQNKIDAEIAKHRVALSKALDGTNPDDLFGHPKIADWANEQSDEEVLALRNPIAYSPKFVAGVLTRFKAEVLKGQAKREPSQGESAVPSRVAPDVVERSDRQNSDTVRFDPRTFQQDVNKLISSGRTADAEKLIKQAEKAMSA